MLRSTKRHPRATLGAFTFLSLGLCACSLEDILPKTALDAGSPTVHVKPALSATKTRALPAGVDRVGFEVVDVLLHNPEKSSWNILNDKPVMLSLGPDLVDTPEFSAVPMAQGSYDRVRVVFSNPVVDANATSAKARLESTTLELPLEFDLKRDTLLQLRFELGQAPRQDDQGVWIIDPSFVVSSKHDDFSDQTLASGSLKLVREPSARSQGI